MRFRLLLILETVLLALFVMLLKTCQCGEVSSKTTGLLKKEDLDRIMSAEVSLLQN